MEAIKSISRIHPLMAAAAVSVIVVSLAGTAAITGLLPSSHSAPEAAMPTAQLGANPAYLAAMAPVAAPVQQQGAQPVAYAQPIPAAYAQPTQFAAQAAPAPAPAPVIIKETVIKEVPVKQAAPKPRAVQHHTNYPRNDANYAPAPRPAAQPNYIAIGTGAVVGGLLGNQVGGGNGRKLATIAGVIGGGMLGNQIANQNR
jgi:uncharacterized protein YcfJ